MSDGEEPALLAHLRFAEGIIHEGGATSPVRRKEVAMHHITQAQFEANALIELVVEAHRLLKKVVPADQNDMIRWAVKSGDAVYTNAGAAFRTLNDFCESRVSEQSETDADVLIELVAAVNARHEHGGAMRVELANELWRGLPDHLRIAIEKREAAIG